MQDNGAGGRGDKGEVLRDLPHGHSPDQEPPRHVQLSHGPWVRMYIHMLYMLVFVFVLVFVHIHTQTQKLHALIHPANASSFIPFLICEILLIYTLQIKEK